MRMKVRHKRLTDLPGERWESIGRLGGYYLCHPKAGLHLVALPEEDYEVVPADTWRDVTAECELPNGSQLIKHGPVHIACITGAGDSHGYRFMKAEFENSNGPGTEWAFKIERREP
jgi:hypothetical protein